VAIETLRRHVAKKRGFDPYILFETIDQNGRGFFKVSDLKAYFDRSPGLFNQKDVVILFDRFDRNGDGKISLSEWLQEICPKSQVPLKAVKMN
jgi:hypothetical protein